LQRLRIWLGGVACQIGFNRRPTVKQSEAPFHDFLTVESHIRRERNTVYRRSTGEYAPRVSPALVTRQESNRGRLLQRHFSRRGVTATSGFFRGVLLGSVAETDHRSSRRCPRQAEDLETWIRAPPDPLAHSVRARLVRLLVQDAALSRRRTGFDSPTS